jgi:hypothetical protein
MYPLAVVGECTGFSWHKAARRQLPAGARRFAMATATSFPDWRGPPPLDSTTGGGTGTRDVCISMPDPGPPSRQTRPDSSPLLAAGVAALLALTGALGSTAGGKILLWGAGPPALRTLVQASPLWSLHAHSIPPFASFSSARPVWMALRPALRGSRVHGRAGSHRSDHRVATHASAGHAWTLRPAPHDGCPRGAHGACGVHAARDDIPSHWW